MNICILIKNIYVKQISEDTESEPLLTPDDKRHQKKEDAVNSSDKTDQEPDQSKKKILVPKERSRSKTPEKLDSKNSSEKSAPKTVSEKPGSKTFDKNGSKTPNGTGSKTPDTPGSKTPDKSGSKTPDKAGSITPDKAGSKTPIKERSKTPDRSGSKTPEEKLTIGNNRDPDSQPSAASPLGGNIFAQIDPTVKKSSPAPSTPSSLGEAVFYLFIYSFIFLMYYQPILFSYFFSIDNFLC